MPNIAQLLKDEISRLARKEVRAASAPLQQQIRELKKQIASSAKRLMHSSAALANCRRSQLSHG